ncbi:MULTISPECIES: ABC transporter permease [unclassified Nocardia]|uniref:ABC transporter permease n=1 Tax=unclassified Nocardia TaxID=2637762 RepID=UPI00342226C5
MSIGSDAVSSTVQQERDVGETRRLSSERLVDAPPPRRATVAQWWALTCRLVRPSWRNGELITALLAPTVFTVGFYVPLNFVMTIKGHGLSSYAQFLTPMIVMQAVAFCAITAAFRAASDAKDGLNTRFGSMAMVSAVPLAARVTAAMYRAAVSLTAALVCAHVIGFRFYGSWWDTVGFIGFAMLIALALCLGADLLGSVTKSPEATTQALILPQLILGMVSTGFAPARQFPSWIQGFARNQPVSQYVYGLRALAGDPSGHAGVVGWSIFGPALAWALGTVVVFGVGAVFISIRRSS